MNVVIDGLMIPGGMDWVLNTASGNFGLLAAATLGLVGAWWL